MNDATEFDRNSVLLNCRVHDDGLRSARDHIERDHDLLKAAPALRFARYPVSAALGAHERAAIAVREPYCQAEGIEVVRRVTGGGALYLDPTQLCWSLTLPAHRTDLAGLLERHGQALVAALAELGIPARFVFPNDIEVEGRKIACGFAGQWGERVLIQGSLLVSDPDAEAMLKILRVPTEKLSAEGVWSARQRMTSVAAVTGTACDLDRIRAILARALARAFALQLTNAAAADPDIPEGLLRHPEEGGGVVSKRPGAGAKTTLAETTLGEMTLGATVLAEPLAIDALKAFVKTAGGAIYLALEVDAEDRIRRADFSGAVQFHPSDLFLRLQQVLQGQAVADAGLCLQQCLQGLSAIDLLGFDQEDLHRVLRLATARRVQAAVFGLDAAQTNTLIVHSPEGEDAQSILERATVMLVPYCAKLAKCKFRHRDDCSECGECEVGDAYRMARERGLQVITITNFEHLEATLAQLQADAVPAYVGMCCESFYLKRHYAFAAAGIPAVLTDISGATCYELGQEDLAYAGQFKAEAQLQLDVVEKVMRFVPTLPNADSRPAPRHSKSKSKSKSKTNKGKRGA